ncbi:hypothetical protein TI04_07730 [Achromatium sp. WMS2]|nr:hypothetical protein TI04_07730 [Achromatium sp. WMS2]
MVILGASSKMDRYANKAQRELMEMGYQVIPVHPKLKEIEGITVVNNLRDIDQPVHTLTMYIGAARSQALIADILNLHPQRVIFNPGSEFPELEYKLQSNQSLTLQACTLVMLHTNQF